ncbi:MAG: type I-E CRISPR-associated protein Cse1/CasA [Thermoguttaceae bacterium]
MSSFDLIERPFISCLSHSGGATPRGIEGVLACAGEIREIRDPSPLVTFAAHRLLLAILHWVEPVTDPADWRRRWREGRFSAGFVSAAVKRCRGHFDLFDAERPFYQNPDARGQAEKSASYLAPEFPTDTYVNHFVHVYDKGTALCPVCCAKGLLVLPPFCTGVGAGNEASINNVPPVYALVLGGTLFETLMLNLPKAPWVTARPDPPAWEGSTTEGPIGFVEGTTWLPRAVWLKSEPADGQPCSRCGARPPELVRRVVFRSGRSRKEERARPWRDWHVPATLRAGRKGTEVSPIQPSGAPEFWRTLARAAIPDAREGAVCAPVLRDGWLASTDEARAGRSSVAMRFFLLETRQAAYLALRTEDWRVATSVIGRVEAIGSLLAALDHADACAERLPEAPSPKSEMAAEERRGRKDRAARVGSCRCRFEAAAEAAFRKLVARVATAPDDHAAALSAWRERLGALAREQFSALTSPYAPKLDMFARRLADAALGEAVAGAFSGERSRGRRA